jgi:DNA-binding SARP family transcriptional activator/tetratricopeptide (TPR) repeat protein
MVWELWFGGNGVLVQVRLLGPVDVIADGGSRPVPGLRRKAVLATLALRGGEVVGTDRLVDAVWGESAPRAATSTLQSHVSYLRNVLGSKAAILARPPGYVLDLGGDGTDVQLAERLLRQGTQSADPVDGARHLQAALALWRGRPLADVAGLAWLEEQAGRLDLLGMQVKRALFEARLAAGENAQLVPDLEQMAADHPLDEQVRAQLMLALYRSGRQADALAAYHKLRRTLNDQLGIDPGQVLRSLETAILQQDPDLDVPAPTATLPPASPAVPIPAQLPPGVPAFAGRSAELASLDAILSRASPTESAGSAAVVISAVSGTAGVGKTALAVHWAHRVSGQFPGGQLYVNLRGFDPDGAATSPEVAVRGFLDALGVPAARIPEGLPAQVGLYRSLLAGQQVLVVLDNARDAEQVRPLLPGSPGCLAIVTSRSQLTSLVATEGAYPISLDLLTAVDARDLLASRLGAGRVASEPDAVENLIAGCARLPLALAIAAARAATNPGFPLAVFATELREATRPLDALHGGDLAADVRSVFFCSYRALSTGAARLFRLLGLHCGPDINIAAAASLAAIPPDQARALLAEVTHAHLLAEHSPGRYAFHDLLRAYATEQARALDRHDARHAAVHRVLEHYLHTAHGAAMLIDPYVDPIALTPPQPGVIVGQPATAADAMCWFTTDHVTLVAAVRLAAETGFDTHAWQLAWTLNAFLLRRGLWTDQAMAQRAGLDAARRIGDTAGEAHARHGLALGYARSGCFRDAYPYFRQALRQFGKIGDYSSQAIIHSSLAWLAERRQRPADMLSHSVRALDLYRAADHQAECAKMLNDIGYSHALLGNYQQAITYCERALAATRELAERDGEAATWDSLGYIHHQLGNHLRAITCYERSVDLCRELADRYNEAATTNHLGDVHRSAGDIGAARRAWTHALRIFHEIDHPDGDHVRSKLCFRDDRPHDVPSQPLDRRANIRPAEKMQAS